MSASISADGLYRYDLTRALEGAGGRCIFIMLNPSTADASLDDPTIRRCIGFANRERCCQLIVLNLFALRATEPAMLKCAPADPRGPDSWQYFESHLKWPAKHDLVICAWGTHGTHLDRDKTIIHWLDGLHIQPLCLGLTKDGHPKHPLYLPSVAPLTPFTGRK